MQAGVQSPAYLYLFQLVICNSLTGNSFKIGYMPVSRILFLFRSPHHLSAMPFARHLLRSTPQPFPINRESREPLSKADIRELSIRKVYPLTVLLQSTVCSYHTFSPLHPKSLKGLKRCGYFLRHYLFPAFGGKPPVRWCGALHCPDFPFLFTKNDEAACNCVL